MIALLEVVISGGSLIVATLLLRAAATQAGQHPVAVYRLSFPAGLEAEPVARFLIGLTGLLRPWWRRWMYQPAVALEVGATHDGIEHRLIAPEHVASSIEAALTAHLPSVRYERLDAERHVSGRPAAAEYRLSSELRSLRSEPEELSAGLLSSLQPLTEGEQVVVQWLLTPSAPVRPAQLQPKISDQADWLATALTNSEAVAALRNKQKSPMLLAVGRIAVWSSSPARSQDLLRQVESPWHASRAPGVHLRRRLLPKREVAGRVIARSVPITVYPAVVNADEICGLIGWPIGVSAMPGLVLGGCRLLPVAKAVPVRGTLLGTSTFPASVGRPVCLDDEARVRHLWLAGSTGAGKTTLLTRMAAQDIAEGHGCVVLDPKGDLIDRVCRYVPERRWEDVIILDAADDARPVGYNPLRCDENNRELVVEQILAVMRSIWKYTWGPRLDDIVRGCLLTLTLKGGMTLAELPTLLTEPGFRSRMINGLHDPFGVEGFWATFNSWSKAEQVTYTAPALNKARSFGMRARLRGVLGQADGAVDFNRIIGERKVLLVDLAAGKLGSEFAYLLGALLFAGLWDAVSARAALPPDRRPMVCAYLDEFQHLVALPTPAETMLAEGRSYGLALTLAHQHLGQLDRELVQAMSANARSKLVLSAGYHDASTFAKELGGSLTPEDLMGIAAHEAVVATYAAGRTQPPRHHRARRPVRAGQRRSSAPGSVSPSLRHAAGRSGRRHRRPPTRSAIGSGVARSVEEASTMIGKDLNRASSPLSALRVNDDASHLAVLGDTAKSAEDSVRQVGRSKKPYVTDRRVRKAQDRLGDRDRQIIEVVSVVHLASGRQLQQALYGQGRAAARIARRDLERLTEVGILERLERRPRGVRGGSLGFVYALDILGQAIVGTPRRHRRPRLPGMAFLDHGLAVTDCYLKLKALEAQNQIELVAFDAEPDCWRSFAGPGGSPRIMKPDAFVVTGIDEWEDRWFVEVDRSTESKARLRNKAEAYLSYYQSGREQADSGVFPKVLWVAPDEARIGIIVDVLGSLPAEYWQLFAACTEARFVEVMLRGPGPEAAP